MNRARVQKLIDYGYQLADRIDLANSPITTGRFNMFRTEFFRGDRVEGFGDLIGNALFDGVFEEQGLRFAVVCHKNASGVVVGREFVPSFGAYMGSDAVQAFFLMTDEEYEVLGIDYWIVKNGIKWVKAFMQPSDISEELEKLLQE